MSSLARYFVSTPRPLIAPGALWKIAGITLAGALAIVARACGYDLGALLAYSAYFAAYVALPGVVLLWALNRRALSIATVFALALPTGFAVEILSYLGLASVGAREVYRFMPVLWLAAGAGLWTQSRRSPVPLRVSGAHAGLALGLVVAFLGLVFLAASQMFAESPLAAGLPGRAIFHDWVYLVSRAGVIKNTWPLDDPSLAGTPLQYHYFMVVHAAAASGTTGVEVTLVLLRLLIVPLGAVLVAQVYLLGRQVARSPWGGVGAALLLVMAGEVSLADNYGRLMYLGLFSRWLFVSPTFFFGMIFCGALLLGVARCARQTRCGPHHYAWLVLLAAAGTGAKGTVLPVLICALGFWAAWRWLSDRRFPSRWVAIGFGLSAGFAMVYLATMSSWRTGDARFNPLHVFQLTGFWQANLPVWQQVLGTWLPAPLAAAVASVSCALIIFAGTCGVGLLAIPYLVWRGRRDGDPLVGWLGAFFLACVGMGLLMELNSYGELYLILMVRLPMSVLAAACIVDGVRRLRMWRAESVARLGSVPGAARGRWVQQGIVGFAGLVFALVSVAQGSSWVDRNRAGFAEWLATPAKPSMDDRRQHLNEALLWIRKNTERNAVIVANACTPENMKKDHWGALDNTLTGVHFYYSALSERRLWFEGPSYIMDTTRARIRANAASAFFYRGRTLEPTIVTRDPCYVLIDRSLADGAKISVPGYPQIFSNARIDIYRKERGPLTPLRPAATLALGLED